MGRAYVCCFVMTAFMLGCGRGQHVSSTASGTQAQQPSPVPGSPSTGPTPIPRPSSAPNITVCPNGGTTTGVDVSDYDPNTQWGTVRNAGYSFAFIKATEGATFQNSLFKSDWVETQNAGIVHGAYHFFHPADDPHAQAQFFLATMGPLQPSDLPPVLDWEVSDGISASAQIANAQIWLNEVESATGKTPMIYVDPSFWNQLGNPEQFVRYPLYIANYGVNCPDIPPPWSRWAFWQSGIGPVPGIQSAQADRDVFNGFLRTHLILQSL